MGETYLQTTREVYREAALTPQVGLCCTTTPVWKLPELSIPDKLRRDETLRATCLSGAIPLEDYLALITATGFGTVEVRAKRPYRVIDPRHYSINRTTLVESVEVCAIKDPMPEDGPCPPKFRPFGGSRKGFRLRLMLFDYRYGTQEGG